LDNKDMPEHDNANVHPALSNTFVCTMAFLIILLHGGLAFSPS
jgi:hypothetical protein